MAAAVGTAAPLSSASPFGARAAAPARPAPAAAEAGGFNPTLAQVIIFVSFTTITTLMLATFWVVLKSGGIHFNDG